jgi:hypothetical protein
LGQSPVLLTDEMRAWEELDPLPNDVVTPPASDMKVTVPQLGDTDDSV